MTVVFDLPPDGDQRAREEAACASVPFEEHLRSVVSPAVLPDAEAAKRERSLTLIDSLTEIGDAEEQKETFEYLKAAIDEDRLSYRKRFSG